MIRYPFGVNGTLTRVLEADGGGPEVVLVHGVGARADRWRHNIDVFADAGYRVLALDLPGHGFATKGPDFDYSVPGYARFVAGFLDTMGTGKTILVGTSLGGNVCAYLACEQPDRIGALVLVGSIGIVPWGPERRAATRDRLRNTTLEGIKQKLLLLVHDPGLVDDAWVTEEVRVNNSPGAAEAYASIADYFADHLDDHVVGERLAELTDRFPILLVWGGADRSVPVETAEHALAMIPGSRLEVIDDAAHAPYYERPTEFNRAVLTFLAQRANSVTG